MYFKLETMLNIYNNEKNFFFFDLMPVNTHICVVYTHVYLYTHICKWQYLMLLNLLIFKKDIDEEETFDEQ